jgi:hypothetical protein
LAGGSSVVGEGLEAQPDALLRDQLGGRLVHQVAVLDDLDACGDRPPHGGRGVRVHADIGAPVLGRLHRGPQLVLGEGRDVERTVRRGHAPAGRQLDLRSPEQELLARADPHLVRRIGHHGAAHDLHPRQRTAQLPRQRGRAAEIAVAASDGDDRPRRIDARPGYQTFVDGALQPERRPSEVAHAREAAHQGSLGLRARQQVQVADVTVDRLGRQRPDEHSVPVVVDQAGHQRAPAALDASQFDARRIRNRTARDRPDDVAHDENVRCRRQPIGGAVVDAHVLEQHPALLRECERRREAAENENGVEQQSSPARHRDLSEN